MNNQALPVVDDSDDEIIWIEEDKPSSPVSSGNVSPLETAQQPLHLGNDSRGWKILIVDDDPDVHHATRLALGSFCFESLPLKFLSAYSASEGHRLMLTHSDVAVVLLDVVMETSDAGLKLAQQIRQGLGNQQARIVLRTGQPGEAPEVSVILDCDINDYQLKLDLSRQRLLTTIIMALRSYRDILTIETQRSKLETTLFQLEQLQQELKAYAHSLELKVSERTTELQHSNAQLRRLAALDGLTQVANRRCFDAYLSSQWSQLSYSQKPLALILLDVDYFKGYNDRYGHLAGDECLQKIAQAIAQTANRTEDLVARYGGEEFAVILPVTPHQGAYRVATSILAAVAALEIPHESSLVSSTVTVSAGISETSLIETADRALYQAKQLGRNRIQFYDASTESA
jgi:diguanylate cyclase (GGDEF)-like protein